MNKVPGLPAPVPERVFLNETIYILKFIKGNGLESKLVTFSEPLEINAAIKAAKRYCEVNRYRFVFIEPAITNIPANIEQEEIVE